MKVRISKIEPAFQKLLMGRFRVPGRPFDISHYISPFMKVMSPYLPISPHISLTFIKVMSLLLRERGMSLAKVAILVGGPDWPTSVTVGIL